MALKEESVPGVYQFAAESVPTFYTQYIDTNGKTEQVYHGATLTFHVK